MKHPNELILYVDDEWANCVVFEQTFKRHFHIECVQSGEAALAVFRQKKVAVIISDQRMPGMSGNSLLSSIRRTHPETVRIVLTAFADSEPVLRAINEGLVARYVVKPWVEQELRQVLSWALEAHILGGADPSLHARIVETERLVTLGKIAAGTVHDMAQPLGYLHGNASALARLGVSAKGLRTLIMRHGHELAATDLANLQQLSDALVDITHDMLLGCQVLDQLIQDVGQFVTRSQGTRDSIVADPLSILRYALATCRGLAGTTQAKLVYQGAPDLPSLRIGSTELAQILINLLANASQAVERQGGGTVTLATHRFPDHLDIVVEDDGEGIPADMIAKLGTPFFSNRTKGTGLGLAQVKRLLHASGGSLRFQSDKGLGTKVIVSIPVMKAHADN